MSARTSGEHAADAGFPRGIERNSAAGWALTSLSLCVLLSSLGTSIANVALPSLAQAFATSFQHVQWVVVAYLLAITVLIVGVGRLGDLAGRRRLLLMGIAAFAVASILCGIASSLAMLIAARAAQGLGAAAMMALATALVGETVSKQRTGSAMGLLATMSAIGTALGPALGGVLIAGLGWRAIFFVTVLPALATLLLAHRYLAADGPKARSGPSDLRWALLRDPALAGGLAMSALVATVMMSTLVVGPFYLARALGFDAARVGLIVSVGPIVAALAGAPGGRLVDRFGATRITVAGLVGVAAGALGLATLPADLGGVGYVAPMVVMTASYALFQAANNTAVMANVDADRRGVTSGMLNLSRNLGLLAGASLMGAVFAFASGTSDIMSARPGDVAGGMRITFATAAALIGVAIGIAMGSGRRAAHPPRSSSSAGHSPSP